MSVQQIETYVVYDEGVLHPIGSVDPGDIGAVVVLAADHARVVAERVAEVTDALIDARRKALAELEQAHAAAWDRCHGRPHAYDAGYADGLAAEREAHAAALAAATDRQRARDYVTLWARIMLEDRKYRAALARAAIVIRQRLTDDDVFRLTGQHVRLHEWETVKPLRADKAAAPRILTADDPEPAVGSVVLDGCGQVWQLFPKGWLSIGFAASHLGWQTVASEYGPGPVTLIHDGGDA